MKQDLKLRLQLAQGRIGLKRHVYLLVEFHQLVKLDFKRLGLNHRLGKNLFNFFLFIIN